MISGELRDRLEEGNGTIRSVTTLSGGSVCRVYRVDLEAGPLVVKVQDAAPNGCFEVEAAALAFLSTKAESLRIPRVHAVGSAADEAYMVMDWLQPAPDDRFEERLGLGLAELHRSRAGQWGWDREGFIGSLPQHNTPSGSWSDFWFLRRLEPQLRMLEHSIGSGAAWAELELRLPELLTAGEVDGPSPLHGDLWSGNVLCTAGGPALIDPACYCGHREVDLAMAELFGGFTSRFFGSYSERWPLLPGYEARKGVYQLYYLLVHVNLFGGAYRTRTHQTLRRVLALA